MKAKAKTGFVACTALAVGVGVLGSGAGSAAAAEACPNEALRTGPSVQLPDCRAYEQVTPVDKSGAVQDLAFGVGSSNDKAIPAPGGNRLALWSFVTLGPNPDPFRTLAILSRARSGWQIASVRPLGSGVTSYLSNIFTSDLSQVGVASSIQTPHSPDETFQLGPPGGPFTTVATTPYNAGFAEANSHIDKLFGASADFEHVVLASTDDSLLPEAAGTVEGAYDLYDFSGGELHLVNVTTAGSLVSSCGAELGFGEEIEADRAHNAVSADGSKVFFTAPDPRPAGPAADPSCEQPSRLYMRSDNATTVEISSPEPGVVDPSGFHPVEYRGASADGSKVFFTTETELTADSVGIHDTELYEYDTETQTLTRISHGSSGTAAANIDQPNRMAISEDGSAVYFFAGGQLTPDAPPPSNQENLYRYDTNSGATRYIATAQPDQSGSEDNYTTPDGRFFLFVTHGVEGGVEDGFKKIYRYDSTDGSLACVSCPEHGAPATAASFLPGRVGSVLSTPDRTPMFVPMSDDGNQVFFETNQELVPQDVNGTTCAVCEPGPETDVYEWHDGTLSLISSGDSQFPAVLLGTGSDGRDVFFATHSQLVTSDQDTSGDVYDARIDGGFEEGPSGSAPCEGDACQTPQSPPADLTPASSTYSGPGNQHRPHHKRHKKRKKHKKHKTKKHAKTNPRRYR